jgi:hypothetical protein
LARAYVDAGADAGAVVRGGPWAWDDDAGVDSYPPQWGAQQPASGPGVSTRAYLRYDPTFSTSTLAVDSPLDPTISPPAYVCELLGPDAGL